MHRYKFNLAFISIGVDYFQVLAIFSATDIRWPTELYEFFKFMMIFNINVDIAAPECLVPNFEYEFKWWGTMMLPVATGVLFLLGYTFSVCNEVLSGRGSRKNPHIDSIIGNFLTLFYYMYLSLTRRALDIFNCNPTIPSDGYLYTEFTSVECSGSGGLCKCGEGIQLRLQAPAIVMFLVFSIGFPWVFGGCRRYRAFLRSLFYPSVPLSLRPSVPSSFLLTHLPTLVQRLHLLHDHQVQANDQGGPASPCGRYRRLRAL